MELPEGLKQGFRDDLKRYEEEKQMPYVTSIERMGIEQGREEEKRAIALSLLRENLPLEMISRTTGLTIAQLQDLQAQAISS